MSDLQRSPADRLMAVLEENELDPDIRSQLATIADDIATIETEHATLQSQNETLQEELQETNEGLLELTVELQDAERRYRQLFETAIEGIYKTGPDIDTYELANPALANILGYETPGALRDQIDSIQADVFVDSDRFDAYQQQLQSSGSIEDFEYQVHTADGETRWVSDNVIAIYEDETVTGYRGSLLDITARKRHERDLRRFKRATEAAGQAIFLTDSTGEIMYANPAFETITGYSQSEAIGSTPGELLHSGEMSDEYYHQMWDAINAGEQWEQRIVDQRKSGEYYHAHQMIAPITDDEGDVTELVAIQADITDHVEQERQVNALDRVLRHNLRNELNIVRGHAERILSTTDPASTADSADQILESVEKLMKTADEGREITRFLSSHTHRHSIDIVTVTQDILDALRTEHPDAQLALSAPDQTWVLAADAIDRAIKEVVTNAIEHNNQEQPDIHVSISADDATDSTQSLSGHSNVPTPGHTDDNLVSNNAMATVTIADNGPGIPELERQLLEDPEAATELTHGSGLGLWLTYWIVRRSGGTIRYEDRTPTGSRIIIELPTAEPSS